MAKAKKGGKTPANGLRGTGKVNVQGGKVKTQRGKKVQNTGGKVPANRTGKKVGKGGGGGGD